MSDHSHSSTLLFNNQWIVVSMTTTKQPLSDSKFFSSNNLQVSSQLQVLSPTCIEITNSLLLEGGWVISTVTVLQGATSLASQEPLLTPMLAALSSQESGCASVLPLNQTTHMIGSLPLADISLEKAMLMAPTSGSNISNTTISASEIAAAAVATTSASADTFSQISENRRFSQMTDSDSKTSTMLAPHFQTEATEELRKLLGAVVVATTAAPSRGDDVEVTENRRRRHKESIALSQTELNSCNNNNNHMNRSGLQLEQQIKQSNTASNVTTTDEIIEQSEMNSSAESESLSVPIIKKGISKKHYQHNRNSIITTVATSTALERNQNHHHNHIHGTSCSSQLIRHTHADQQQQLIKRDRKNLVKNFIKAFRGFLNSRADEKEVLTALRNEHGSQEIALAELSRMRAALHKFLMNKHFNNTLMIELISKAEFAALLHYFFTYKAPEWIAASKIKDKLSHEEALVNFLRTLDDNSAQLKLRCLKQRTQTGTTTPNVHSNDLNFQFIQAYNQQQAVYFNARNSQQTVGNQFCQIVQQNSAVAGSAPTAAVASHSFPRFI